MSEPIWNWQRKVERLRQLIEKNDLNCTFEVAQTSRASGLPIIRTADNISELGDMNTSSTTSLHGSECLVNVIDYSDFDYEFGCVYRVSDGGSSMSNSTTKAQHSDSVEICEMIPKEKEPQKCSIACNTSLSSNRAMSLLEGTLNWIPLLEMVKHNILNLFDEQIRLIKSKCDNKDALNNETKSLNVREKDKLLDSIERTRKELLDKMNQLNCSLRELKNV